MKKVLIQIGTEFHYMVALSIIEKFYTGPEFEIHFLITKNPGAKSRLDTVKLDERFTYHIVPYNHTTKKVYPEVTQLMNFVKGNEFFHFVSFLYHDPLFVYLTYYFKKKNTESYLAPDGMGAYVKFTASNMRSRIVNSLNAYRFFKDHGMSFPKLWLTSWDFGKNGYYDYIYAYSKTLPYVSPKTKIVEVDYTLSQENQEKLKNMFSIDFSKYPALEKIVLLINDRHKLPKYETDLLEVIKETMPGYKILFKKHPNQAIENLSHLEGSDVYMIDEVYPVEILIASLKDSVIISSYSNSMLYHNPDCHYFWTYPIITASSELKKPIERHNPKKYIKVVSSFKELKDLLLNISNAAGKSLT